MSKLHVHFLGINGSGASAVAAIAQSQGFIVTGCDKNLTDEFTGPFAKKNLFDNHNPKHLKNVDILAVTPAVFSADPQNSELQAAKKQGIKILTWQEFMGQYLEKDKFVIAVCGTHGKSTTTAMIGRLLEDAALDPIVELGATVTRWGANYRVGGSKSAINSANGYFVTEADEFNNNFLVTHPDIAVVTNIEMDHPEFFKDFNNYEDAFFKFLTQTKQTIVANISDPKVADVLKDVMKNTPVTCVDYSKNELNLDLIVPGRFNQLNASAAFQVGLLLGIDPYIIKESLENFTGISRRFELIGVKNGARIYSDFGHHPTEVKVTIEAAKEKFADKKLIVVFQPHMYSRTRGLWDEFKETLKNLPVSKVIVLDIYKAREEAIPGVTSKKLVEEIDSKKVIYASEDLARELKSLDEDSVVFFMGAGTVDNLAREFVK